MTAVVIPEENLADASTLLAGLRAELNRRPGDTLHWRNFKKQPQRLLMAQGIGQAEYLTLSSVVVCKPHLTGPALDDDTAYLYTLRYLLERLSWLARDQGRILDYTLAHIVRFKKEKLATYEGLLQQSPDCNIAWQALDPGGGRLDAPANLEYLQLADSAASATYAAFEPHPTRGVQHEYLTAMSGRLYRRPGGKLTSYGLKMHPWSDAARAAYPWVSDL